MSAAFPFAVLGNVAGLVRRAGVAASPVDGLLPPPRPAGSRRRRLWELPHKFHCPLVGVCFDCQELRTLMKKVMHFPPGTTDFVLHTTAVGACEERTPLAEAMQKTLEQRYRLAVRGLAGLRDTDGLRNAWRQVVADGTAIPATLWACWTHPAMDAELEQEIFADIHMIQHQVGAGTRADLQAMERLRRDNAELRRQLAAQGAELDEARAGRVAATQAAAKETAGLRAELAAAEAAGARVAKELAELRARIVDLDTRETLARRAAAAEAREAAERRRAEGLAGELARLRATVRPPEPPPAAEIDAEEEAAELPATRDLAGKCVLCVGGRTGAVDSYREVVEQSGGRFVHHDGGVEENLQRIDSALAAADIVICQVGCISHNAYWRVKAQCKRTGKPCMFVKSAGVSSFGRAVEAVGRQEA
ncbi:MAG: DUF2325 domain-containing protein [Rhodocyclaceae bacterium]|nr:DUF2325 domain-containing protein [Rhodocyclaceae bacterium]